MAVTQIYVRDKDGKQVGPPYERRADAGEARRKIGEAYARTFSIDDKEWRAKEAAELDALTKRIRDAKSDRERLQAEQAEFAAERQ